MSVKSIIIQLLIDLAKKPKLPKLHEERNGPPRDTDTDTAAQKRKGCAGRPGNSERNNNCWRKGERKPQRERKREREPPQTDRNNNNNNDNIIIIMIIIMDGRPSRGKELQTRPDLSKPGTSRHSTDSTPCSVLMYSVDLEPDPEPTPPPPPFLCTVPRSPEVRTEHGDWIGEKSAE